MSLAPRLAMILYINDAVCPFFGGESNTGPVIERELWQLEIKFYSV